MTAMTLTEANASIELATDLFNYKGRALLTHMKAEFRLDSEELQDVGAALGEYGAVYRQYGTAQIISSYSKGVGITFRDSLPDPEIEFKEKSREASLDLLTLLRSLDFTTNDINSITEKLKDFGEAGRVLGYAEGYLLIANR
jgi:hypothetical protein